MDQNVLRSVGLLRAFVVLSAVVLAAGAAALGILFAHSIRSQAVQNARDSLSQYVDGVLASQLERGGQITVNRDLPAQTLRELTNRPDILSVKVWRPDGVLAYTNLDPSRIGKHFATTDDELEEALDGKGTAAFADLDTDEASAEASARRQARAGDLRADPRGRLTQADRRLRDLRRRRQGRVEHLPAPQGDVGGHGRSLPGAVAGPDAPGAHRVEELRRQYRLLEERSAALEASYERLESSTLEAIESLNATVEAKDPYTAGHSQRVQQLSLLIGQKLGLDEHELDALGYGALFHDIGKISIPDAILTKPAALTDEEYECMKRPPARGRAHRGEVRPPQGVGADHPPPPRALGWPRLPRRPFGRAHPAARHDRRALRRLGCDDHGAPVQRRRDGRCCAGGGPPGPRHAVRAGDRGRSSRACRRGPHPDQPRASARDAGRVHPGQLDPGRPPQRWPCTSTTCWNVGRFTHSVSGCVTAPSGRNMIVSKHGWLPCLPWAAQTLSL